MIDLNKSIFEKLRLKRYKLSLKSNSIKKKVYHYIHVGRCGGTALKRILTSNFDSEVFSKHSIKITINDFELWLHSHKISLKHIPKGHKVFFTTRDPLMRFISGFNRRLIHGAKSKSNNWSPEEKYVFSHFQTPYSFCKELHNGDVYTKKLLREKLVGIKHVGVFGSYWDFFHDEEYLKNREADILCCLKQETLSTDFKYFTELVGIPSNIYLPERKLIMESNANPLISEKNYFDDEIAEKMRNFLKPEYDFLKFCEFNNFHIKRGDKLASS